MSTTDPLSTAKTAIQDTSSEPRNAAAGNEPVGILDLGSNSVRIVIFERLERAPLTIFNEKILCGLGRDLPRTGRLNPDGIGRAIDGLKRFRVIASEIGVSDVHAIATAAVREAEDGPQFLQKVERETGFAISTISGQREAELAALGLISAIPGAKGIVADLGGGSMEVAEVSAGKFAARSSLPLGPFRLMAFGPIRRRKTRKLVDNALENESWLHAHKGEDLYLIGGAWRAVAKAHMAKVDHPLQIVQQYSLSPKAADKICADLIQLDLDQIARQYDVSIARLPSVPYAALALSRLLKYVHPARVVFCAHGIREGYLFDLLSEDQQKADPLIEMANEMSKVGRPQSKGDVLFGWMTPLFPDETVAHRRLRYVSCLLSDIGWRTHPDYRAEKVLIDILRAPFVAIEHNERAIVALSVFFRHKISGRGREFESAKSLLDREELKLAQKIGYTLQLARVLTGGITDLVNTTALSIDGQSVTLKLPRNDAFGTPMEIKEAVGRIGQVIGLSPEVEAQEAL